MVWPFATKKKIPKIPLPEGHMVDQRALKFPSYVPSEKVIELNKIKEAVGSDKYQNVEDEIDRMPQPQIQMPKNKVKKFEKVSTPAVLPSEVGVSRYDDEGPLYIKVDAYQVLLGKMEEIKDSVSKLNKVNTELEESESNEENKFDKLKRTVKGAHDSLLQLDKIMFKGD